MPEIDSLSLIEMKLALDAHAIVAITDAAGTITYANDKFCEISKWSRDELLGQDHRIINSGHHTKDFFRNLWRTIRTGQIWKGEIKNRAKDGTIYWVDTTIVPILDTERKPVRYVAIRAEITERKSLEEQNRQVLEQLQAANAELSEFAYVVSHDLKAPLRGINSLAIWLQADHAGKLGKEGTHQLTLLAGRVARLNALVDGILAYSRAGRIREKRVPTNLETLLQDTIDLLAPPQHISITIATPLPTLTIEPFKAQQLFQNLLSNAIKFMDKPAGQVVVSCTHEPPFWRFAVKDNGPGIEKQNFEKVFLLFQTLAPRDQKESTGVGLALVKKIVELEGGSVWVDSLHGIGATIHFTLPCTT